MPDPVITQRTVHVEHIKIESSKPFAEIKAALDELVPPLDPTIPEALRQGDIARANEALQRGPELAIFSTRDHGGLLRIAGLSRKARLPGGSSMWTLGHTPVRKTLNGHAE